jgi:hypothetical protein
LINADKKTGYFTSNRAKSKGEDDIFSFTCTMTIDDPIFDEENEPIFASTEGGDAMGTVPRLSRIMPKHIDYKIALDTPLLKWVVPALESKPLNSIALNSAKKPVISTKGLEKEPQIAAKSAGLARKNTYIIVVGTYAQKEYALDMKRKMENLGFKDVEIIPATDSRLSYVSIQRFTVEKEAYDFSNLVENKYKFDAFVKLYR